jgi:hypothetical protein
MKILITGTTGLAQEIACVLTEHKVTLVSRTTGHNLLQVNDWGAAFLDYDCVFNCAYGLGGQQLVLEYFYNKWHQNSTKHIISIGSKIITQPRSEPDLNLEYWTYRIHKQTLQHMHDTMWPTAKCDLKIINPGAFDSNMVSHLAIPKMRLREFALQVKEIYNNPLFKRVDLWL